MENSNIKELTIEELFGQNDNYQIPVYQRNYAWTKVEVEQLVIDINDYAKNKNDNIYYIGTLVVYEREVNGIKVFETIDGQQRLTTLSILLSALKNQFKQNIEFRHLLTYESRELSKDTLKHIYNGTIEKQENLNPIMENAYKTIKNSLKSINKDIFTKYLLSQVKILRVNVPKDTDLNHYFEIMNNRGEQLEKHEVLKARMIEKLSTNNDKKVFNDIWETCSEMYQYIHYGFGSKIRDKIFGKNWNSFICSDFECIKSILYPSLSEISEINTINNYEYRNYSIDDIIEGKCKLNENKNENKEDDKPDRFTSPINFPNFLLHVLKITRNKSTSLDDKSLLDTFKDYDESFVKNFGFNLLKMRFLLDNYIIKREYTSNTDNWSLKQAYKYETGIQYKNKFEKEDKNKQILMLLSMFHVSNPSPTYKYWLTSVLNYLFFQYDNNINEESYLDYLENLAEKFLKNRYLAKKPQDFDEIIFANAEINYEIDIEKLDKGTSVEHFIFNYIDYLLWKANSDYNYFTFSFSNSIEHFYPQNPIEGHEKIKDDKILNSFGNLCLISVNKNAKLNNHPPFSKKAYYPNNQYDSLKQHKMMEKAEDWNIESINKHKNEMLLILKLKSEN